LEVAGLYSGWLATKGKEVLRQENASKLNETWAAFHWRILKITVVATPIELFVRNLPFLVVTLVISVAQNGPVIRRFVGGFISMLGNVKLVDRLMKIDEAASTKRDYLLLLLV
jgi:hypothetical protein